MWWIEEYACSNLGPFGPDNPQHFKFKQGTVGLIGANGAGKSTVVESMIASITGDWSGFNRPKVDCVNKSLTGKGKAFVRITLNRDGRRCHITRNLKPSSQSLVLDGLDKEITSDAGIKEKLTELGIDRDILDFAVFKRQNRIYDFLHGKATEKAEAYAVLCKMKECEKIWRMFGDWYNRVVDGTSEVTDNSDTLTQSLVEIRDRLTEIKSEVQSYSARLLSEDNLRKAEKVIVATDRLIALRAAQVAVQRNLVTLQDGFHSLTTTLTRRQNELATLRQDVAAAREAAELARETITAWNRHDDIVQTAAALRDQEQRVQQEISQAKPPQHPAVPLPDLEELHHALLAEKGKYAGMLSHWQSDVDDSDCASTDPVACPACGQLVADSAQLLRDARARVRDLDAELLTVRAQIEQWRKYAVARETYERRKVGWTYQLSSIKVQLADRSVIAQPEVSRDDATRIITGYEQLLTRESTLRDQVDALSHNLVRNETRIEEATASLGRLTEEIDQCTFPAERVQQIRQRVAEHTDASLAIARLTGERQALERSGRELERQLKECREALARNRRNRAMARIVLEARDAIHREKLPQRVAQANLIRLEKDINRSLGLFGKPFWVEATDDLSFMVHKHGEPPHRAEWLSGGQQVILAIAFWDAVGSLFRKDVGMLVLDEPTANLDETNVSYLAEAMASMTNSVRGKRQIIVVTHAESLICSFDQVIRIGG